MNHDPGDHLAPVTFLPGATERAPAEEAAAARDVAVSALAARSMSRREVERLLATRGVDEATVAGELERLERDGVLDDLALAQTLVGTLQERRKLGRAAIAAELTRRLLSPAAIEYGLELVDSSDELARARELAQKRVAQLRGYDRATAVRRLSGYLARRGYSGSAIRAAVEQALPSNTVRFS
jgi:regulatory protein